MLVIQPLSTLGKKILYHKVQLTQYCIYISASGRIVSTSVTDNFESLKDTGYIYVDVENTGEVTADFSVRCTSLKRPSMCFLQVSVDRCSRGVTKIAAKKVSINPGEVVTLSFIVQTYFLMGNQYECESKHIQVPLSIPLEFYHFYIQFSCLILIMLSYKVHQ